MSEDALKVAVQSLQSAVVADDRKNATDYQAIIQKYADKVRNPMTAIRAKCIECSCGSLAEVHKCVVTKCALHPFRMGINPHHKRRKENQLLAGEAGDDSGDDDDLGEEDEQDE